MAISQPRLGRPARTQSLASGVVLRLYRLTAPPQRVSVISIDASAPFRVKLVPAGRSPGSFATTTAIVRASHGLAGVNGYFTSPPDSDPMLIRDGAIVAGMCRPPYCMRDPRTALGITARGSALLVTVDGRLPGAAGLKRNGMARLMLELGAVWAVNLDGGGSTTMVARGRVVNRPSDRGMERRVRSGLIVIPSASNGLGRLLRRLGRLDPRIVSPILWTKRCGGLRHL